jgi:hypothetical protein
LVENIPPVQLEHLRHAGRNDRCGCTLGQSEQSNIASGRSGRRGADHS